MIEKCLGKDDVRAAIVDMGHKLTMKHLVAGSWGNISSRIDDKSIAITPSGLGYEGMQNEDVVILANDGQVLEGRRIPSSESKVHLAIYNAYSQAGAVIHTHSVYASALAAMRKPVPAIIEDIVQIIGGRVNCAEYALPGTQQLAINTIAALQGRKAALLANHGAICWGKTLADALIVAEILEKAAQIAIICGDQAYELTTDDIKSMHNFYEEHYNKRQIGEE